jgi:hypothetical protein
MPSHAWGDLRPDQPAILPDFREELADLRLICIVKDVIKSCDTAHWHHSGDC